MLCTTVPVAQAHSSAGCINKEPNKVVHNKGKHILDLRGITHKTRVCAYILAPVQPKFERQEKGTPRIEDQEVGIMKSKSTRPIPTASRQACPWHSLVQSQ